MTLTNSSRGDKHFNWVLLAIGLTGLFVRFYVGEVLRLLSHHGGMTHPYFIYAQNLIDHHVFSGSTGAVPVPDSLRMPLYSLFLAAVRLVSGPAHWEAWVALLQYLMGGATCALIGLLGKQIAGARVGVIAAAVSTIYLDLVYISIPFLRETLTLLLLLVALNAFALFLRRKSEAGLLLAAASFGLGILGRAELFLVLVALLVFFWPDIRNQISAHRSVAALGFALAFGPLLVWMIRNALVQHHFVPFSTDGAWGFYMGQVYPPSEAYDVADKKAMEMIRNTPVEYDWYTQMDREARTALLQHPLRNLHWGWLKIQDSFQEFAPHKRGLFYPVLLVLIPFAGLRDRRHRAAGVSIGLALAILTLTVGHWDAADPISWVHTSYSEIVLLGAVGFAWLMLSDKTGLWKILAAPFLTFIFSNLVFIAHLRQRVVLCDWLLIIAAAFCISSGIEQIRTRSLSA